MALKRMPGTSSAWSTEEINASLSHSLQREAFVRITNRINDLRSCREARDLHEFQLTLFDDLNWAQAHYARASRALKRMQSKQSVEDPEADTWELEMWTCHRVEREFRSVGDCLAWKFFDCDRRYPTIFSRHPDPGLVFGKAGADTERRKADEILETEGRFALMNDLTLSFRAGDLTVRREAGVDIIEVKANQSRSTARQRRLIQSDLDALTGRAPLEFEGVPLRTPLSTIRVDTALASLEAAVIPANRIGPQAIVLGEEWILLVQSATRGVPTTVEDYWLPLQERAKADARLDKPGAIFNGEWSWHAWNSKNSWVAGAPFGIFPLPPVHCAALTCGYLIYQSVIGYGRLARAFEEQGYEVTSLLPPEAQSLAPEHMLMSVSKRVGDRLIRFNLKTAAFNQVQFELFTPECIARALNEVFVNTSRATGESTEGILAHGSLAFAHERSVWRV